ncbi:MAG: hypothetical protein HY079_08440 [Elusimicrobia bacterium]|nr:hypothetical protein [Elusimicrobiota bacterium]
MRRLLLAASLTLVLAADLQAKDKALVGSWDKDGAPYAELKADGTGTVEGKPVNWDNLGRMLVIVHPGGETETAAFTLKGDSLQLLIDGRLTGFTRGKRRAGKPAAARKETARGKSGSGRLAALLTSSPWCSFTYNQISGASHQERVVFKANGTWGSGSRGESYSSGPNGSVAGQSGSAGGGRWETRGERLFMSEGNAPLEDAGIAETRNSNGYPILRSGAKEYSQCR